MCAHILCLWRCLLDFSLIWNVHMRKIRLYWLWICKKKTDMPWDEVHVLATRGMQMQGCPFLTNVSRGTYLTSLATRPLINGSAQQWCHSHNLSLSAIICNAIKIKIYQLLDARFACDFLLAIFFKSVFGMTQKWEDGKYMMDFGM